MWEKIRFVRDRWIEIFFFVAVCFTVVFYSDIASWFGFEENTKIRGNLVIGLVHCLASP